MPTSTDTTADKQPLLLIVNTMAMAIALKDSLEIVTGHSRPQAMTFMRQRQKREAFCFDTSRATPHRIHIDAAPPAADNASEAAHLLSANRLPLYSQMKAACEAETGGLTGTGAGDA